MKDSQLTNPIKKLAGIVVDGTNNSLINHTKFFDSMAKYFSSRPDFISEARNIRIISFRKKKQYDILEILKYIAWKLNIIVTLDNADSERIAVQNEDIETILHEFHDAWRACGRKKNAPKDWNSIYVA